MTAGKRADRLVTDDPRSVLILEDGIERTRADLADLLHDTRFDFVVAPSWTDPDAPYIATGPVGGPTIYNPDARLPAFRMTGLDALRADAEVVVRFGQAAGQIAEVLADLDPVPVDWALNRLIEARGRALDAATDRILRLGGVPFSLPCEPHARVRHVNQAAPPSKRSRRRSRGRARRAAR